MDLEVDLRRAPASARLLEPDDFGSFKVVLVDEADSAATLLEPVGVARLDEYAWVRVQTLRELAGTSVNPEWEESLRSMLEFARSRGWVDDELAAVRGHVVRHKAVAD